MFPAPLRISASYGPARAGCNPALLVLLAVALACALLTAAPAPAEARLRILAIGDSLTAGYGLPQGEGLVPQLQRWLEGNGAPPVEVVDMGVSGDTTSGGRARLDWVLAEGADAVILELGANDMLRGVDPAVSRTNLAAMLAALDERGLPVLLIGMRAAENFGADYKAAFDAIYPELAARYGALLDPYYFEGLEPGMFLQDGLHPNPAGIARVVERVGPLALELIERVKR